MQDQHIEIIFLKCNTCNDAIVFTKSLALPFAEAGYKLRNYDRHHPHLHEWHLKLKL
jgi:hypothetical protein